MDVMKKEQEEQQNWVQEREDKIQSRLQAVAMRHEKELKAQRIVQDKERAALERSMNDELEQ